MASLQSRIMRSPIASTSTLRSLSTSARVNSAQSPYSNPHATPRPEDMHRMNKYSHRITSDKTQGASQVREIRMEGWERGQGGEGGRDGKVDGGRRGRRG